MQLLFRTSRSEMVSSLPKLLRLPRQLSISPIMEPMISGEAERVRKAEETKNYWKQPVERNVQRPSR
jgi:hypothetical protein